MPSKNNKVFGDSKHTEVLRKTIAEVILKIFCNESRLKTLDHRYDAKSEFFNHKFYTITNGDWPELPDFFVVVLDFY